METPKEAIPSSQSYILENLKRWKWQLPATRSEKEVKLDSPRFQYKSSQTNGINPVQQRTADLDTMFSPEIQSTPIDSKTSPNWQADSAVVLTPQDRIRQLEKLQDDFTSYPAELNKDISFVMVTETPVAKTIMSFTVGPQHTNRFAHLHGSCAAAIFQIGTLSALALVARKGYWSNLGAGRSLRVTYLKPVEEGDGCWVTSEVVCAGKRMCLIKSIMTRISDGEIVASCEHERVDIDSKSSSKL